MRLRHQLRVRAGFFLLSVAAIFTTAFGVGTILVASPTQAAVTVPYLVNFQGRLTDTSGNILTDGSYNIKFRLWTAATSGTNVWQADRVAGASDYRVTVTNGLFNLQFGDATRGDPALTAAMFSNGTFPLYLEVELPTPATASCATNGCAVFTEGAMTPRQPLASSPYAISADTLDGIDSASFGQLSAVQSWNDSNTFSKASGAAVILSGSAASGGSILQIGSALSGGSGSGTLFGANTTAAGDLINLQVSSGLRFKVDNSGAVTSGGNFQFTSGAARSLAVAQAASGAGNNLTLAAGQSATGAFNGGDLILQAGATGGSGTSGSVRIIANGSDVTTAFQVQNAAAAPAFTIDTVANKIVVGDATGTNAATSLLVVDTATVDPATGYNGAMFYNSTANKFRCYQNGAWADCGGASVTATSNSMASFTSGLQNVPATVTATPVEMLVFTSATAVSNVAGPTGFTAPAAGSFRSCLTKNNAAITAGTLNLRWRVNGAVVGAAACAMNSTANRQAATSLDNGVTTFAAGDVIDIAYDTVGLTPAATNDFTTFWSVEYNSSSGNGLTLQFVYDSSASPATINLASGKNLVVNAADTATDASVVYNLQCATCSSGGGRFAVQNAGTDAFVVSPNSGGIALNQSTTLGANANLSLSAGAGVLSQAYTSATSGASGQVLGFANTNAAAGASIQGMNLTPTNTTTPSSGTNTLQILNFATGAALGASNVTNGINFASSSGYTNFIQTPSFDLNSSGDITTAFTDLGGTSTSNGTGTTSTTLILTSAADFDIGNYVQVASANCGGTGVNPCYAKITNKASNTLTITPALTWANGSTVNEFHVPEIGGINTAQTLANRFGRGYFIAGVAAGNGTTFYNEDSIDSSLTDFSLLTSITNLTVGGAATTVSVPGNLSVAGQTIVNGSGQINGAQLQSGTVANVALANSAVTVSAGTGLSGGGSVALGASTALSVTYGSSAGTAAQGNTTITCPSGTGNLTGGGTSITLGAGGTCGNISAIANPTFATSVTSPTINATAGFALNGSAGAAAACSSGQANLGASFTGGILTTAGTCTSVQSAGNYLVQAPASTSTNTITAPTGVVGLSVRGTNGTSANVFDVYNSAASPTLQSYFDLNGAFTSAQPIAAPTATNSINGLVINSGAITGGTWQGTAIGGQYGGTGQTNYAVGDLLYANSTTSLARLAGVALGSCLISGGTNTAPSWSACAAGSASTTLNNLGTTSINASLLPNANNSLDVGSAVAIWNDVFTSNLDAGTTTTALTVGTAATTTAVTLGRSGLSVSIPGGLSSSGALSTSGNIATTGSGTITSAGGVNIPTGQTYKVNGSAISSANLSNDANITKQGNTFNGTTQLVQTNGSGALPVLSGANLTSLTAANLTGALPAISGASLTNLNPSNLASGTGAVSLASGGGAGLVLDAANNILTIAASDTTLQRTATGTYTIDLVDTSATSLAVINSNAGAIASLTVEGGVSIGSGQTYKVNGTQISSADLSNDANLAKLSANQTFTGTNTLQPTTNISSLIVRQNSSGSFGQDVFSVQGSASGTFIQVTSTTANQGAVTVQSLGANALTLQSGSGTITLGSSTALTSTGALALTSGAASSLTINPGTTGTLNLGTQASSKTIQIGQTTAAVTDTIGVGNSGIAGSVSNLTIGNLLGTSTTIVQAGANGANPTLSLQTAAAGVLALGTTTANAIQIGAQAAVANASTVNIAVSTGAAQVIDIGGTGLNAGSNAGTNVSLQAGQLAFNLTNTTANVQSFTNSATAFRVQDSGSVSVLTADTNAKVVLVGSATTDTTQVLLQPDSFSTFADTATCATTTNQGALYYNTNTNAIRGCVNGGWEDMISSAGVGLLLYGVIPDSANAGTPGDIVGVSNYTNSPCKVTWTATQSVTVNPCNAYSGGRKIIIPSTVISTAGLAANAYANICLTGTASQPALGAGNANENLAAQPTFNANNPMLCLATVRASATAGNVGNIWDTRTFTNTVKKYATVNSANSRGHIVVGSATPGVYVTTTTGASTLMRGVVVGTSGTASTTAINAILAINGPTFVKFLAGGAATVNNLLQTTTTAGYGTSTAFVAGNTTNYTMGGPLEMSISTSCTTANTVASACQYAPLVDFSTSR